MLTVIGTILGLLGSIAPEFLKTWRQKGDQLHEREMFKLQMQYATLQGEIKVRELEATADIEETKALYEHATPKSTGFAILDGLTSFFNHTVRPSITYAFMTTYILVKYAIFYSFTSQGYSWDTAVRAIWSSEDFAVFSTIMAFWFGGRFMKYALEKFKK
jgi:hypothetical protein